MPLLVIPKSVSSGGSGEANTASNVGVGGIGVFKQKTGVDLELRNIAAASSKISVALDAANNEVDIDVVEANIDHDSLSGFVADEHIAHSGVTLTAGAGLSGGGDISANRSFAVDTAGVTRAMMANLDSYHIIARNNVASGVPEDVKISELTEETAPASGDFLLGEESGGALRKFDILDIPRYTYIDSSQPSNPSSGNPTWFNTSAIDRRGYVWIDATHGWWSEAEWTLWGAGPNSNFSNGQTNRYAWAMGDGKNFPVGEGNYVLTEMSISSDVALPSANPQDEYGVELLRNTTASILLRVRWPAPGSASMNRVHANANDVAHSGTLPVNFAGDCGLQFRLHQIADNGVPIAGASRWTARIKYRKRYAPL